MVTEVIQVGYYPIEPLHHWFIGTQVQIVTVFKYDTVIYCKEVKIIPPTKRINQQPQMW